MVIKLVKKADGVKRIISESYFVNNLITSEISKNVSLSVSEAARHLEKTKNSGSDRIYFVIDGELVIASGKNKFIAKPGDAIFIKKGTEYTFGGTFMTVLVNSPAFNPKRERIMKI
jgi:ethanolamine utilization protein EutQ (cupin superfamily)